MSPTKARTVEDGSKRAQVNAAKTVEEERQKAAAAPVNR
jgi:hypothetical protein